MSNKKSGKVRSQRQLRVGELIRRVLAETMQRGLFDSDSDIRLEQITVTEVQVSPDFKNATAFVMPLGGFNMDTALAELNENASYFSREIGKQIDTRNTPRLKFALDYTLDEADRISRLLNNTGN